MNITLTLDTETTETLSERVDLFNAGSGEAPITPEQFMTAEMYRFLESLVATKRISTVEEIRVATASLPYEKRVELAQINRDFIETSL